MVELIRKLRNNIEMKLEVMDKNNFVGALSADYGKIEILNNFYPNLFPEGSEVLEKNCINRLCEIAQLFCAQGANDFHVGLFTKENVVKFLSSSFVKSKDKVDNSTICAITYSGEVYYIWTSKKSGYFIFAATPAKSLRKYSDFVSWKKEFGYLFQNVLEKYI